MNYSLFNKALNIGRPPNIKRLFPNSKALIVSGKFINDGIVQKGKTICIAVNARNYFIVKGALLAAQHANSAIIIEIARSEGGTSGYCSVNYWNLARLVDNLCNELSITIPVAIHADHYTIKTNEDIINAEIEIPNLYYFGITSIALDASHLIDSHNLLTSIKLIKNYVPNWSGLETEVGEIKGPDDMSTEEEAKFMIGGLNAYNIFPDWIAINNGTVHGVNSSVQKIDLELTCKIHNKLKKYNVYGAQHGTSGNNLIKLKKMSSKTLTTKANIATSLQMISWGVRVDDYGNAILTENGLPIKLNAEGVSKKVWYDMMQYAKLKNLKGNDLKKLNLPFDNILMAQSKKIMERMSKSVENYVYNLLINVFNSENSADFIIKSILENNSYYIKYNEKKIETIDEWTKEKILKRALKFTNYNKNSGNYED